MEQGNKEKRNCEQAENQFLSFLESFPELLYELSHRQTLQLASPDKKHQLSLLELIVKRGHEIVNLVKSGAGKRTKFDYIDTMEEEEELQPELAGPTGGTLHDSSHRDATMGVLPLQDFFIRNFNAEHIEGNSFKEDIYLVMLYLEFDPAVAIGELPKSNPSTITSRRITLSMYINPIEDRIYNFGISSFDTTDTELSFNCKEFSIYFHTHPFDNDLAVMDASPTIQERKIEFFNFDPNFGVDIPLTIRETYINGARLSYIELLVDQEPYKINNQVYFIALRNEEFSYIGES